MQYLEINITPVNDETAQIIVAYLSEMKYDTFVEEENVLKAYILESDFDAMALQEQLDIFQLKHTINFMAKTNWNAEWEKNYDPVIVNDAVAVRASFHPPIEGVYKNIIITPKMSFGTGHHSTTHMMLQFVSQLDLSGKTVLDYGCGTGVLGIYASMQGASKVIANDIEDWCVENTLENAAINDVYNVEAYLGDLNTIPQEIKYDLILANINLNILMAQMNVMVEMLLPGGVLICSGILVEDQEKLQKCAEESGVKYQKSNNRLNWLSLYFVK